MSNQLAPGDRVAAWRRIKGFSVRRLSAAAGLYPSALCDVEKGRRNLRAEEAERIASALGLTMAEFYGETPTPPADPEQAAS